MNKALFSSASTEWETPQWLFDALHRHFCFSLDVCATAQNAKCAHYFDPSVDALALDWSHHRCWMNPPYGREIGRWVEKARREAERGALVVGLLPARTDTTWWLTHVQGQADVRFLAGRLHFSGARAGATFPSALALWWGWPVLAGGFAG